MIFPVLTEDERVDDVEGLNRTLTRWAAEEDDAGGKKYPTVNELYSRFVTFYHSRVHPDYPIMSVNFELAMGGLAKCKTRVGHQWNRVTTVGPTVTANQSPPQVVVPNVQPTSSPKITSTVSFTGSNISPFSSPAAAAAGAPGPQSSPVAPAGATPGPVPMAGISPLSPPGAPANVPPSGSTAKQAVNVSPIPPAGGAAKVGQQVTPPPPAVSGTAVTPPPPGVSGHAGSPPPGSLPGTSRAGAFSHSTPVSPPTPPPRRVSGGSSGSTRSSTQSQGRSKSSRKRSRGHLKFRGASQAGMLGMPPILPQAKQRAQTEVRKRSHIRQGQEMALQNTQAAIDEAHTQGEVEVERALKELYDTQQKCMLQASPGQSSSSSGGDLVVHYYTTLVIYVHMCDDVIL